MYPPFVGSCSTGVSVLEVGGDVGRQLYRLQLLGEGTQILYPRVRAKVQPGACGVSVTFVPTEPQRASAPAGSAQGPSSHAS